MWSTFEFVIVLLRIGIGFVAFNIGNVVIRFWPNIKRPTVKLKQGTVQGITSKLPNGKCYHYFKGIPYAKPPVGNLRFRAPVPLEKFSTSPINCSSDKGFAVQDFIIFQWPIIGTEDILYLNIFTPALPTEAPTSYPVMVYIHGGGFRYGTAHTFVFDPKHLVQDGVIVVTVYYRLGPLGFLCLPNAGISGNAGLKDQLLALRWVSENISHFGGDAANVTLFGESAGAWSSYLHYLSPNSRKYFHRVICQSGDSCSKAMIQTDPETKAKMLARVLGCESSNDMEILEFLTMASARKIVSHQDDVVGPHEEGLFRRFVFRPVIEQQLTDDSIITKPPEELVKEFDTLRMPIITGCTTAEGMLAMELNKRRLAECNKHPEWLAPCFVDYPGEPQRAAVGKKVKQFYLGDKDIGWSSLNETCKLMSDVTIVGSSVLSAELIAKYQPNVSHYHYSFTFRGRFDYIEKCMNLGDIDGASHGNDIFYMFSSLCLPSLPNNSGEHKVRDVYIKLFTNFAKFSNPTPNESLLGFNWNTVKPVSKTSKLFNLDCLEINQSSRMVRNPNQSRKEFIRNLIKDNTYLL